MDLQIEEVSGNVCGGSSDNALEVVEYYSAYTFLLMMIAVPIV